MVFIEIFLSIFSLHSPVSSFFFFFQGGRLVKDDLDKMGEVHSRKEKSEKERG